MTAAPNGKTCRWCGTALTGRQARYCSRSCTRCGQNRSRAKGNR